MRKYILSFLVLLLSYTAYTQCTPNVNLTHSGFYPSPLPDGKAGVAYNQVITFQFPTDTTIVVFGSSQLIHIDTVIIQSVSGFPSNYTTACNVQDCKYWGTSLRGCMQINGTPTVADTGSRKLVVSIIAKFKLVGSPITAPFTDSSQTYTVQKSGVGISRGPQVQNYIFGIEQIHPNPFNQKTVVTLTTSKTEKTTLVIRDLLGKEVYVQEAWCKTGSNNVTMETESLKPGYYFLSVTSTSGVITRKITKR